MMPVQNDFNELLYAYALGCLDMPDLDKLTDYINSGGEYSRAELGELQNLTALFPSILSMEIPSPQLKDNVARKLYRIKGGKQEKKTGEKPVTPKPPLQEVEKEIEPKKNITEASGVVEQSNIDSEPVIREELFNEEEELKLEDENIEMEQDQYQTIQEFEVVTAKTKEQEPEPPVKDVENPAAGTIKNEEEFEINLDEELTEDIVEPASLKSTVEKNIDSEPEPPKVTLKERQPYSSFRKRKAEGNKSGKAGIIVAAVLFVIVAAGLIFVYLKVSSDVTVYKNSVEQLNRKINSLSSRVNNNRDLQKLLLTKNVKIVNLAAAKNGLPGYGKLIISFENSKGYLQLSNVPPLSGDDSYELWVIINGHYTSLGNFKPSDNPSDKAQYFPFRLPELSNSGETKFLVSEESSEVSKQPSGRIILTGSLQ